jgi:hypothetical protein
VNTPTGKFTANAKYLGMPQSNQKLADVAILGGKYYRGKTIIRLNDSTMDVTNFATGSAVTTFGVPWPNNGVLYVDNGTTACTSEYPTDANYDEGPSCGNVYVSGSYSKSLTIAARSDIIIKPTIGAVLANGSTDSDIVPVSGSDATLGLIADNFIRVAHRVQNCNNYALPASSGPPAVPGEPIDMDVRIEAAMLSLKHSFIADNYNCGRLGTLTVIGAISQRYRGTVSTFNQATSTIITGFTKDYWYDDRFRYRSPPYFLSPVDSAWDVVRMHEQVPAR